MILKAALYKPWSYVSPDVPKRLEARQWTKWMFTDASAVDCPHCGAPKYFFCITPKGRRAWPPHPKRLAALQAIGYGDANRVDAVTPQQAIQTRKEKQ